MVGMAMRAAFSLGLHVQDADPDQSVPPAKRQNMIRTWWSLHSLESLLSSITGRPSIIPNEHITTSPRGVASDEETEGVAGKSIASGFVDADSNLNLLTQQVITNLYTQRKSTPSWDYIQQTIITLVGDLDKWAVDSIPRYHENNWNMSYEQQREVMLLKLQYYRLKILTTRPSLRRIERCYETGTDEFTSLDQSVAETCIQAAQDVAALVTGTNNVKTLYEQGPWWSIVHNSTFTSPKYASTPFLTSPRAVMQALAVLMNAIACPERFTDWLQSSAKCVKQLVGWLRALGDTNAIAARAYRVLYSIVKMSKPSVWNLVVDAFPDEVALLLQQSVPVNPDLQYLPWPEHDQPSEALFQYEADSSGDYHYRLL
jgi:hypothetical protein